MTTDWPSDKVRQTFVDYFATKQNHTIVPSGPVVPHNDPTLLFTNAGMNQFKEIFTGQVDPSSPFGQMTRACDTQKCIRAGGKHNDLDDVGKDTYHHTFFEMLGNWSFGDYFKTESVDWAMDLLVNVFGLDVSRIYATYYQGDPENGLECDIQARDLWLKYLPAERVLPFDGKDNFWEMGDTGPCGPCTEVHYDLIGGRDASSLVNMDDPTVIEIWNLVFMQFNRGTDGKLTPLPAKHVDTGAGFERLVAVLQGKKSNYDTDVFTDLFKAIEEITGAEPYSFKLGEQDKGQKDMAYRVIGDHIRTLCVAIADGAVPDSDGRGYVLRRIVRRAVRYGTQNLGAKPGFFHLLVPAVVAKLGDVFPELIKEQGKITRVIKREEELFMRTLEQGTKRLNKLLKTMKAGDVLDGARVFDLYSTFGFPPDLTELMCDEHGVKVDQDGFKAAFDAFRVQRNTGGDDAVAPPKLGVHETSHLTDANVAPTDDDAKYNVETNTCNGTIVAIFDGKTFVDSAAAATAGLVGIVLDKTNFYAEAGGQVGDVGQIVGADGKVLFDVSDTQRFAGFILHTGTVRSPAVAASLAKGASVRLVRDESNRSRLTANHTTTHMLNFALSRVLGGEVVQKGSKVVAESLRFDFSSEKGVTPEELAKVDEIVCDIIAQDLPIYDKVVGKDEALEINGLKAVFGEKYPDPVRVVSIGVSVDALLADKTKDWGVSNSIEFCGGTHMARTKQARTYVTVGETAVSQGVRRIVGVTKTEAVAAYAAAAEIDGRLTAAEAVEGVVPSDVRQSITDDIDSIQLPASQIPLFRKRLDVLTRNAIAAAKQEANAAVGVAKDIVAERAVAYETNKPAFVVEHLPKLCGSIPAMRTLGDGLLELGVPSFIVSADAEGKKPAVILFATVAKNSPFPANKWVQEVAAAFGGKGGGRPTQAQAKHTELDAGEATAKEAIKVATAHFK